MENKKIEKRRSANALNIKKLSYLGGGRAASNGKRRPSRALYHSITDSETSRRDVNSIETFSDTSDGGDRLKGLEAVRHAYLCDKKNHFLRCTMLTLAEKRSQKQVKQTDKLLAYQEQFFKRRGKKPTIDDIISLGNAIKKFSNCIHALYEKTNKKKISYFLKWKLTAFGFRKQLMKQLNSHFEEKFEKSYKRAKKLMLVSRRRFSRKKFEAFSKWKFSVKSGMPIFTEKKWYKSIIFELIKIKNERDLKDLPLYLKSGNYMKTTIRSMTGMQRIHYYENTDSVHASRRQTMLFNSVKRMRRKILSNKKSVTFKENKTPLKPPQYSRTSIKSASFKPKPIIKKSQSVSKIKVRKKLTFTTPLKEKPDSDVKRKSLSRSKKKKIKPPIPKFFDGRKNKRIRYPTPVKKDVLMAKYRPMDQIQFFSKFLNAFETIRLKFENCYRDFFFKVKMMSYTQGDNNFANRQIRGLT